MDFKEAKSIEIPLVAVWMVTYNHSKYIGEAIEGVLKQKTSFKIKLFIGEDCSTDNTKAICLDYQSRFPETIEVISTKVNNIKINCENLWNACGESGAKYIAKCEGDDYWTDPYKLQKQVDFLEANNDFSICFASATVKAETGEIIQNEDHSPPPGKDVFTIEDFILSGRNLIPTATIVFRNILPNPLPDFYYRGLSGDICIQLIIADKGKAKHIPEKMAVYRRHAGNITKSKRNIEEGHKKLMELFNELNRYFNFRYSETFKKRFLNESKVLLISGAKNKKGLERIKHYLNTIPDYFKYSDKIDLKEIIYYHTILFFPAVLKLFKRKEDINVLTEQ